jgi:hypothetical protein
MATPFLVASSRDRHTRWLLAVGEAVLAFCAFDIVLGLLIGPTLAVSQSDTTWLRNSCAASLACVTSWLSYKMGRVAAANLVPGQGIEGMLAKKLLVIRAAGDEASAALGAAYILRWALVRAASAFAQLLTAPARFVYEFAVLLRFGPISVGALAILLVILCFLAELFWPKFVHLDDYAILGKVIIAWFVIVNIVGLTAVAFRESVSTVVHGIVSVLVGAIALPFGYDLFLATPYLIVAAEAVPPARDVQDTPQVMQLKLQSSKDLQHSVYDDADTASAISCWIRKRINPEGGLETQ